MLQVKWEVEGVPKEIDIMHASEQYVYITSGLRTFTMFHYFCDPYEAGIWEDVIFVYDITESTTWVIDSNLTPPE